MNRSRCPDPALLVRFAHGDATPDEMRLVETHAAACPECRGEIAGVHTLGPAEAWGLTDGSDAVMPEALWSTIAAERSVSAPAPAFRIRIGGALDRAGDALERTLAAAGRGVEAAGELWVSAASAGVRLIPLAPAAVRGAGPERALAPRVRALAGDHEFLLRVGPDRLTVTMIASGAPAEGRRLILGGAAETRETRTDSTGAAVFRDLPPGEYRLDVEVSS